jgi:TonB family protein
MRSYLFISSCLHASLLAGLLVVGSLLAKPRMSYYAVDLFSSSPAGGTVGATGAGGIQVPVAPASKELTRPAAHRATRLDDTLRLLSKLKQKRLAQMTANPVESATPAAESAEAALPAAHGRGGMGLGGSGPGIVAESGVSFPYPWYLKAIADRLDKQWRPPSEFAADTSCQVTFVIHRSGQIYGSKITQKSGDDLFDQLALRAVLYANPLPPLPSGFPDDALKVHMNFLGKRN